MKMEKKRILVAPLNWGLGHATRCIPIIRELEKEDFIPVLASDGAALEFLRKEFPHLEYFPLPSYNIRYSRFPFLLKVKLLTKTPHILKTISEELNISEELVKTKNISGIISDNRWGIRSESVPSVFITHQIQVLSGILTFFSSKIQQNYIQKFNECWIPDIEGKENLSGKMSVHDKLQLPVKHLGILSRFDKVELPLKYDVLAVLSGPEPQRSMLEKVLLKEFRKIKSEVCLVRGVVEKKISEERKGNITIYNFLNSEVLEQLINGSRIVICRPGYTSVMDLIKLDKKAFFIPTPGQPEQQYLAKRMKKLKLAPFCQQEDFKIGKINEIKDYKSLGSFTAGNFNIGGDVLRSAFALFKGE